MFNKKKKKNKQSLGRIGRVEREQRYNQYIRITTFVVIGLVLVVTIAGLLINTVFIPNSTIVTVNGQKILTSDFQKRVRMERDRLVNEYNLYQQFAASLTDVNQQQQYIYYLIQLESQLEKETIGETILNQMIDELFVVEEAKSRGITVTDEELEEYYQSLFGYYPNGYPTQEPMEIQPTSTLSATQYALITPTPAPEDGPVETPTAQPLPTSVSIEDFETSRDGYLDRMKAFGVDEDYLKNLVRVQLYQEKLDADIKKSIVVPLQEQVWARHILVDELDLAETILEELENGGDFGDLALKHSTGPSGPNGGDLGWFSRGQMVEEFEEAAFSAEIGDLVGPVQTEFGFHIIQILGKEDVPADDATVDNLVFAALSDILSSLKEEADIVYADNWIDRTPTDPDIIRMAETN
ncbi:MAG: peptidylprolyl isomerase [Anaerolineales bacterium]|nr:peptidylprolyl isomerase [Anaerolineales bacterium]